MAAAARAPQHDLFAGGAIGWPPEHRIEERSSGGGWIATVAALEQPGSDGAQRAVDDAAQLAAFMSFVNGNIARVIGCLHDWRHRFWARRYRAIVVADETAAVVRLRYVLENGCKEGLVDRPIDGPGLSCVRALTAGGEFRGTWYDRTTEFNARRRGERVVPGQFASEYQVHLSPLPCWRELSRCAPPRRLRRPRRNHRGQHPCRASRIGQSLCGSRPRPRPKSPRPPRRVRHQPRAPGARLLSPGQDRLPPRYADFVDAFRATAASLRRGQKANFPAGAFPPGAPFVAAPPAPG